MLEMVESTLGGCNDAWSSARVMAHASRLGSVRAIYSQQFLNVWLGVTDILCMSVTFGGEDFLKKKSSSKQSIDSCECLRHSMETIDMIDTAPRYSSTRVL